MAVNRVTIHHEAGPGELPTAAQCSRFSEGGYCCGIGTDTFARWRSAYDNYATMNFNGQDWTPCFGGDRHTWHGISDHDLAVLHDAFMDAYNRGEVTAEPEVIAHRNSPGSSTACPGDLAMQRWNDIVNACRVGAAPQPGPEPEPEPEDDVTDLASAINHDGRPVVFQVGGDKKLYMKIRDAKGGGWSDWRDLTDGFRNFATVTAFVVGDGNKRIEIWVTMVDGKTFSRIQTDDFASWKDWVDQTR